jgi:hypothetical protein
MFCPLCQAEFQEPLTVCPNCGARMFAGKDEAEEQAPRTLLWQGNHPGFWQQLEAALEEDRIPHWSERRNVSLMYPGPLDEASFCVFVLDSDLDRAKRSLSSVEGSFTTDESAKIGVADTIHLTHSALASTVGRWDADAQGVSVWSGKDEALAEFLRDALRANSLEFRTYGNAGQLQKVEVHPEDAARAKEIVREIVEGTPLE